jgi:hypothetical protein
MRWALNSHSNCFTGRLGSEDMRAVGDGGASGESHFALSACSAVKRSSGDFLRSWPTKSRAPPETVNPSGNRQLCTTAHTRLHVGILTFKGAGKEWRFALDARNGVMSFALRIAREWVETEQHDEREQADAPHIYSFIIPLKLPTVALNQLWCEVLMSATYGSHQLPVFEET